MRINEMRLSGVENPQLPRRSGIAIRTSETDGSAKISLRSAFVSFHPNPVGKGSGSENDGFPGFFRSTAAVPLSTNLGWRVSTENPRWVFQNSRRLERGRPTARLFEGRLLGPGLGCKMLCPTGFLLCCWRG